MTSWSSRWTHAIAAADELLLQAYGCTLCLLEARPFFFLAWPSMAACLLAMHGCRAADRLTCTVMVMGRSAAAATRRCMLAVANGHAHSPKVIHGLRVVRKVAKA